MGLLDENLESGLLREGQLKDEVTHVLVEAAKAEEAAATQVQETQVESTAKRTDSKAAEEVQPTVDSKAAGETAQGPAEDGPAEGATKFKAEAPVTQAESTAKPSNMRMLPRRRSHL